LNFFRPSVAVAAAVEQGANKSTVALMKNPAPCGTGLFF
jgi:hypothetical protein